MPRPSRSNRKSEISRSSDEATRGIRRKQLPGALAPSLQSKVGERLRPAIVSVLVRTVLRGYISRLLHFAIGPPLFPRQADASC